MGSLTDRFIFFPRAGGGELPAGVQSRFIDVAGGERVHALWAPSPAADAPVLLWSHGNAGNVTDRAFLLPALTELGASVLAYDYRGYGLSNGSASEEHAYEDALAVYDHLRAQGFPASRIVLMGESLGGAVSIQLATERPAAGLALLSTFTTIRAAGMHHLGPLALVAGNKFNSLARIRTLDVPVLVAHGDADEVIPFGLGEELFEAARCDKEFVRLRGGGHNDVLTRPEWLHALGGFVRRVGGK